MELVKDVVPTQMPLARAKMPFLTPSKPGVMFVLSLREKLICDTFLVTQSYEASARAVRERFRGKTSATAVKTWLLKRPHIQAYLRDRLLDTAYANSLTREKWLREAQEYRDSAKPIGSATCFMHKLMGQARGYLSDAEASRSVNNTQINFYQSNGEKL